MSVPVSVGRHEVILAGEARAYELRRSDRRTLAITVEPGGRLVVTAPATASLARIEGVLRRRREWIRRRSREVALLPPPPVPREWVSGETHRYLGRQYRLKVSRGERPDVRLVGQFLHVTVSRSPDPRQARRLVERWYLEHARSTFARRMEEIIRRTARLRLSEPPPLVVRKIEKRWGSCSAGGRILMNIEAVKLPAPCIDYLLLHELCHLRVPHHGPRFWRMLDACMPDWERWRRRIDIAET